MSTKRQTINDLRAYRAGLVEKQEAIAAELEGIEVALTALNGPAPKPRRQRRRSPRQAPQNREQNDAAVLRFLQAHPNEAYSATELRGHNVIADGSLPAVTARLLKAGKVRVDSETERGAPRIRHKPTVVRPGEPVQA